MGGVGTTSQPDSIVALSSDTPPAGGPIRTHKQSPRPAQPNPPCRRSKKDVKSQEQIQEIAAAEEHAMVSQGEKTQFASESAAPSVNHRRKRRCGAERQDRRRNPGQGQRFAVKCERMKYVPKCRPVASATAGSAREDSQPRPEPEENKTAAEEKSVGLNSSGTSTGSGSPAPERPASADLCISAESIHKDEAVVPSQTPKLIKPDYANPTESDFYSALNGEIEAGILSCNSYMDRMMPFCTKIEELLQDLATQLFHPASSPIKAELYGSMATRLALPGSDLDIIICGLGLYEREAVVEAMTRFSEKLGSVESVAERQPIMTARVPVIKAVFNLTKLGAETKAEEELLHVDIIFDMQPERGSDTEDQIKVKPHPVMCAELISYRCENLDYLKPVTLLLKRLLKSAGLKNPYFGILFDN